MTKQEKERDIWIDKKEVGGRERDRWLKERAGWTDEEREREIKKEKRQMNERERDE